MKPLSKFLTCALLGVAIAMAQVAGQTASLSVHIGDKPAVTMTAADFSTLPRHTVAANEHGKSVPYEGVLLHDVLERAGVVFQKGVMGKALSTYVLATASDGYQVVYTLADLDPTITDGDLLVADKSSGQALAEKQGPFRIVAPHDKKPARSLRMLERIDVVELRK